MERDVKASYLSVLTRLHYRMNLQPKALYIWLLGGFPYRKVYKILKSTGTDLYRRLSESRRL